MPIYDLLRILFVAYYYHNVTKLSTTIISSMDILNVNTTGHKVTSTGENGRVLLVNSYVLLREGLANILRDAGYDVVSQGDSLAEALRMVDECGPAIVLVDADTPDFSRETIEALSEKVNGAVVLLVQLPVPDEAKEIASGSTRGCLSVHLAVEDFVEALRLMSKGSVIFSPDTVESFRSKWKAAENNEIDILSEREREVIKLIGEGASNREVAETLIISEHTVKAHLRSILNKLNLRNRQQMAAYAVRHEIVTGTEEHEYSDSFL